ncbi:MAG TPA: LuxR C-terminal-related transcriptional regulator [Candidatus Rubrimentiphilum sp.]|nr:LuxR C-terminal-related transcriptional regulator [Candidatus Rubrimentiphilum sp.]
MAKTGRRAEKRGLTRMEQRVVDLIIAGRNISEICEILDRATYTVRNHVSAALHHYGVSNQAQLVARLMRDRKPIREGRYANLTPAQRRVVDLMAQGLTRPQIANRLRLSPFTVHNHLKGARDVYGVTTQAQLISKLFGAYRR